MRCEEFFQNNKIIIEADPSEKKNTCSRLKLNANALDWESENASEFSPGNVRSDEVICRQLFSPVHYNEQTEEIVPAAFTDIETFGFSTNRYSYINELDLIKAGIRKAARDRRKKNNDQQLIAMIDIAVSDIRDILDSNGKRAFVVLDTASENDKSHCDIFCLLDKAGFRRVRSNLFDLANKSFKKCNRHIKSKS